MENTHHAYVVRPGTNDSERRPHLIAGGSAEHCGEALSRYLQKYPGVEGYVRPANQKVSQ